MVITSFERFSDYSGYSTSFKFAGNHIDQTPIDLLSKHWKTRLVAIVAVDALYLRNSDDQYAKDKIKRELKKAFVGFKNYRLLQVRKLESLSKGKNVARLRWNLFCI